LANSWTATLCVVLNMNEPYIVCVCVRARARVCVRERGKEGDSVRAREQDVHAT
jgi:hypothetical protein